MPNSDLLNHLADAQDSIARALDIASKEGSDDDVEEILHVLEQVRDLRESLKW